MSTSSGARVIVNMSQNKNPITVYLRTSLTKLFTYVFLVVVAVVVAAATVVVVVVVVVIVVVVGSGAVAEFYLFVL